MNRIPNFIWKFNQNGNRVIYGTSSMCFVCNKLAWKMEFWWKSKRKERTRTTATTSNCTMRMKTKKNSNKISIKRPFKILYHQLKRILLKLSAKILEFVVNKNSREKKRISMKKKMKFNSFKTYWNKENKS